MDRNMEMAGRIAARVAQAGGRSFYVGGFVRDRILGRENKDIDIEIHGVTPGQLAEILDSLGKRLTMGASFGVFGLRNYDLDIAMPRKEKATGRGHRDFDVFVDPFIGVEKAAMRRDFTMNALMQDVLTGEVVDCFGGVDDLKRGVIRHVNDESFAEDALRVLRAAQFAARFGFEVAAETRALCATMDLSALASERVLGEMEKALLKAPTPSVFFGELAAMGQLGTWFPAPERMDAAHWSRAMRMEDAAAGARSRAEYPLGLMLSALCVNMAGEAEIVDFLNRLTNEARLIKYTVNMNMLCDALRAAAARGADADDMAALFDRAVSPEDLIRLVGICDGVDGVDPEPKARFLGENLEEYRARMALPFVRGEDLVREGFRPCREFGEALKLAHGLRLRRVPKEDALAQTCAYLRGISGMSE